MTAVKERPILFDGEMVRAIIAGRKTQTRRVINMETLKVVPRFKVRGDWCDLQVQGNRPTPATMNQHGAVCGKATNGKMLGLRPGEFDFVCPYMTGKTELVDHKWIIRPEKKQRLYVRETWCASSGYDHLPPRSIPSCGISYPATDRCIGLKKRPSIHMPRWASRITLEITAVRVERLQDIGENDAVAEGIHTCSGLDEEGPYNGFHWGPKAQDSNLYETAVYAYERLWESINGPGSWAANPWVWVIEFRRVG